MTVRSASSVLQRKKKYAAANVLVEGDSCWNSDQFLDFSFTRDVVVRQVQLRFQGGFVGQEVYVMVSATGSMECMDEHDSFDLEDTNKEQRLDFDTPVKARGVRLLFPKSTDFYGRITLYSVHLLGEVPE